MRPNTYNVAPCAPLLGKKDAGDHYPHNTDDFIRNCLDCDACFKLGAEMVNARPAGTPLIPREPMPVALNGRGLTNPVILDWNDSQNRVEDCPGVRKLEARIMKIGGLAAASWTALNGGPVCNGTSIQQFRLEFDAPVDLELAWGSMSNGVEQMIVVTPVDEFYPGPGATLPRQNNLPAGTAVSNANQSLPSWFVYRNVTTVDVNVRSVAGLSCGFTATLLRWYDHLDRIVCPISTVIPAPLAPGAVRYDVQVGCQSAPAPAFLPPWDGTLSTGWEWSVDFGANWFPAVPGTYYAPLGLAVGQVRWRRAYTVPLEYSGFIRFWADAEKFVPGSPNSFGSFWLDGVQIAPNTEAFENIRFFSEYQPLTPGNHTIEWRGGAVLPNPLDGFDPRFGTEYFGVIRKRENILIRRDLDAGGAVVNTSYWLPDGVTPMTPFAGQVITAGACPLY